MPHRAGAEIHPDGALILDAPVTLPAVLDMLIVGGGPFGTAAAFHAKELGLAALVIDHDDVLSRIRDYTSDKQILPDFGGGDRMPFPEGGALVASLRFDPIDKDEMWRRWKQLYRQHNVPAQIGVEMIGAERAGALWTVTCWNSHTNREQRLTAKHVILAVGRGVPRELDVFGNPDGLAFVLKDAASYVGSEPVCVIGGGISAAEAVIAISQARYRAHAPGHLYWSYRSDKMPKVPRALAEAVFTALSVHGNVRFLPGSEPVAITGDGDHARLAIRTSRRGLGEPVETTQLEFRKHMCVACIGEDIPERLLSAVGCAPVTGGPENRRRIAISPLLETKQPGVFLAGDVLSPIYFETRAFDSDPTSFREVQRRGNIKAALRDGVFVARVIAQKLTGRRRIVVDMPGPPADGHVAARAGDSAFSLIQVLSSGIDADEFGIRASGETTVGGVGADVAFPEDSLMAERHAVISAGPGGCHVKTAAGAVGVYMQPAPRRVMVLGPGMLIRAGQQWFQAGSEAQPTTLIHFDPAGDIIARYDLAQDVTIVGRDSPHISVGATDATLSQRHFAVISKNRRLGLKDFGSTNGTYVQVDRPIPLAHGDCLVVGRQKLRFSDEGLAVRAMDSVVVESPEPAVHAAPAAPAAAAPVVPVAAPAAPVAPVAHAEPEAVEATPEVKFAPSGPTRPCERWETILEVVKATGGGVPMKWQCEEGYCGLDPVEIISGAESLSPMEETEESTLKHNKLNPACHRLACVTRVNGPVVVKPVRV